MRTYNLCEGGRALRIAVGITVLVILLFIGSAAAVTLTVNASGGAMYTKIQDAINNANEGDTIFVYNGTYYENIILKDGIRVHGENVGMTTIDGVKATSVVTAVGVGPETVLDGFTITNGTTDAYGGGIYMQQSSVVIMNNIIIANSADAAGAGIFIYDESSPTINGNIITNNGNSVAGGGIYVHGSFPTITNNIISENSAGYGGGVGFASSSGGQLANNVIIDNTAPNRGGGIDIYHYSSPNIINNIIASNSGTGIHVSFESFPLINFNDVWNNIGGNYGGDASPGAKDITADPIFINSAIANYHLQAISPCIDVGNNTGAPSTDFDGNHRPIDGNMDGIAIVDIGVYEYIPVASSSISGFKINDTNGNGVWDVGETGIQGWNITLKNATTDAIIASNLTDANGFYQFMNLVNGNYNVTEEMRIGFTPTNATFKIVNIAGLNVINLNFTNQPMIQPVSGVISGFKINDTNGNGKWDASEKGISNWTIRLIGIIGKGKNVEVIRKETFTDATGFYKFEDLPAGRYFVIEKLKKGFVPTSSPVKRVKLAQDKNSMNNNFTNRPVQSRDKKDDKKDIDDYEAINRDINKYKEDTNWD